MMMSFILSLEALFEDFPLVSMDKPDIYLIQICLKLSILIVQHKIIYNGLDDLTEDSAFSIFIITASSSQQVLT